MNGRLLQELINRAEYVVSPCVCIRNLRLSNGEIIKLVANVISLKIEDFPKTVGD